MPIARCTQLPKDPQRSTQLDVLPEITSRPTPTKAQPDQNKIDDKSHVDKPSPLPTKNNWRDSDDMSHVVELCRFIPPKNY
mmetsp:Transcript_17635/g.26029  ORF Transcript_17635/g.26029 Transcript_17635/m.26029 type:complete len:81 (+) Transcript_17635:347-589(+)